MPDCSSLNTWTASKLQRFREGKFFRSATTLSCRQRFLIEYCMQSPQQVLAIFVYVQYCLLPMLPVALASGNFVPHRAAEMLLNHHRPDHTTTR
ncbi:hypothetical protein CCR75_001896 [Bremia lactucae]|uniref:Uncharacterized protein n=1 Tax=Bremia lactucae TaxID=4779 RepID=A0A976FHI1_BRELC|nr:hypothetical protein CCR75_001896 [Bremia lactucae]